MTATKLQTRPSPQRTCVGCGTTTNKRELVRVVRTAGEEPRVTADPTGKLAGRGAYVCAQPECWEKALKKGGLERTLKTAIKQEDADALREYAASLIGGTE